MSEVTTEALRCASCTWRNKGRRSSCGTMRSNERSETEAWGARPKTRDASGDISMPPADGRQSKLPMRARSWARASLLLLRSSSMRVRDERNR